MRRSEDEGLTSKSPPQAVCITGCFCPDSAGCSVPSANPLRGNQKERYVRECPGVLYECFPSAITSLTHAAELGDLLSVESSEGPYCGVETTHPTSLHTRRSFTPNKVEFILLHRHIAGWCRLERKRISAVLTAEERGSAE
ncbi:hypothetical protein AOLI_G00134250 [Acnodon oligacanthus]